MDPSHQTDVHVAAGVDVTGRVRGRHTSVGAITPEKDWDPRYTHQCPACLLLTEGEQTCQGDLFPSIFDRHTPARTVKREGVIDTLTPGTIPR